MDVRSILTICIVGVLTVSSALIIKITGKKTIETAHMVGIKMLNKYKKSYSLKDKKYRRHLVLGRVSKKRQKRYEFLNDLTIDLGLKKRDIAPYQLMYYILTANILAATLVCQVIFGNLLMYFLVYPMVLAATVCILYTKANICHEDRVHDIIEAENTISASIGMGVVASVEQSIDALPIRVKAEFETFISNIKDKNWHIRKALEELEMGLGTSSKEFIRRCIVLETRETSGTRESFKSLIQLNNIEVEIRVENARKIKAQVNEFIIGVSAILLFLIGVIAAYPDVRDFYFNNIIGKFLILMDFMIVIAEFVYITKLRASEV